MKTRLAPPAYSSVPAPPVPGRRSSVRVPASAPARPGAPPPVPRAAPVAVSERCQGCGACLLTCPAHAIRPQGGRLLVLADLCTGCFECIDVCPVDAIDEIPSEGTR